MFVIHRAIALRSSNSRRDRQTWETLSVLLQPRYWAGITNYFVTILIPITAYGPEEITSLLSPFVFHLYKEEDVHFPINLFQRGSGQLLVTRKDF